MVSIELLDISAVALCCLVVMLIVVKRLRAGSGRATSLKFLSVLFFLLASCLITVAFPTAIRLSFYGVLFLIGVAIVLWFWLKNRKNILEVVREGEMVSWILLLGLLCMGLSPVAAFVSLSILIPDIPILETTFISGIGIASLVTTIQMRERLPGYRFGLWRAISWCLIIIPLLFLLTYSG
ncbi:MAG: hypothetical protein WCD86_20120, partial [Ktedonobacteraceae bacterium]